MNYSEDQLRELEVWPYVSARATKPSGALSTEQASRRESPVTVATDRSQSVPAVERPHTPAVRRTPVVSPVSERKPGTISPLKVVVDGLGWDDLQRVVSECKACGLCAQRKQAVFGVGATGAPWLFVGEGPGAEEDAHGEPFVGQAGKLLDAMLASAGLQRGREVYIANVVKCRPPGNRTPTPEEALACAPYLDRQIDLIKPSLIVALGKTAVTRLTGEDGSMASLRGQTFRYRGIPVVVTYHPAYLLRSLPDKLKAWEDLMLAKKAFGEITPA